MVADTCKIWPTHTHTEKLTFAHEIPSALSDLVCGRLEDMWYNHAMATVNKVKEVKEFIIKCGVNAVLESAHCEIKHGRTIEGLMEYLKYAPKLDATPSLRDRLCEMILEYFGSEKEHPFEIVKRIHDLDKQANAIEDELTAIGVE